MNDISLIVGLGNPGDKYRTSRHNAGFWMMESMLRRYPGNLNLEKRFKGETGTIEIAEHKMRLLAPQTYMNLSGESVTSFANYYRIRAQQILVLHDELDLPPGMVRLKLGGGHGGHNGIRDIANRLGSKDFARLRIGIGRPTDSADVVGFVLRPPPANERKLIEDAIERAVQVMPWIALGDFQNAMNCLHAE